MDREDAEGWDDPDGGASIFLPHVVWSVCTTEWVTRMAYGLGMDVEEWQTLRAQVDDSFWMMRIIGSYAVSVQDDATYILTPHMLSRLSAPSR